MVRRAGDGLASEGKIVQNATKYGLTSATHWGRHARCSKPNPNATTEQTAGLRVPNPNSRGHATKRGFRDCPGFLNSTGRLGLGEGRFCEM